VLRFKAEGHLTAQGLPTCQLGTPRCNMKGEHEYIDINSIYTSQRAHKGVVALQDRTDRQHHCILRVVWHPEQQSTDSRGILSSVLAVWDPEERSF